MRLLRWLKLIACSLLWALPLYLALWRVAAIWLELRRPPWWAYFASAYLIDWTLALVGFAVVYFLAHTRMAAPVPSEADETRIVWSWWPRWAKPWTNLDEGVNPVERPTNASGGRWWDATRGLPWWKQAWLWSAWRNPVSGTRWMKLLAVDLSKPPRVEYVGNARNPARAWRNFPHKTWWIFARQGLKCGLWIVEAESGRTTQLGWRVYVWDPARDRPIDAHHAIKAQFRRKP